MRLALTLLVLASLAACAVKPRYDKSEYAEIATNIAPGCEQPSARFRDLRDEQGRAVQLNALAVRVRPGIYDIGLSCGVAFDSEHEVCVAPKGNIAEQDVPTYKLNVRPKARYLFSCLQEHGVWTYHMVESDL